MGSWYQKNANYKTISSLNIIYSLSSIGFQILYAVIAPHIFNVHPDYRGLLGGYFFSTFLTTIISLLFYLKPYWKFKKLASFKRIKEILKIEKKFFLISLPNDLMQTASNELPTLFLSKTITVYEVGNIGYARRFLGIPLTIGSNAIAQIFSRKAIEEIHKNDNCKQLFIKTAIGSFLIGLVPFILLLLFGPQLFAFVFGEKWFLAGEFAQILGFYYYLNFIVGPLTYVYFIRKKLFEDFLIHLYLILSSIGSLYVGYLIFETSKGMLFLFTVNYSLSIYILFYTLLFFKPNT
jgi:teichuronic acid exporter